MPYNPAVYQNEEWFRSLAYTDEWNRRALLAVLAILGRPSAFLDLGCGNGALVDLMRRLEDIGPVPIDYSVGVELWLPPGLADARPRRYIQADLRDPYDAGSRFDLVTCWEVAEHLPPESADTFCDNMARHVKPGGHLVFTAAAPGQGGEHHVNEQCGSYWRAKLEARGLQYDKDLTGPVALAWQWATGPCFWLPANVMVFGRDDDG